jgi:hypothetical protein
MLRLFLVAAFGLGLTTSLSAQTDADRWQRHPERCVEEVCRHLSPRDCDDATNVNRLLQACAGQPRWPVRAGVLRVAQRP